MNTVLLMWLLSADPVKSDVKCETVAQCWLDADGKAIARPKAKKGKPLPQGDCGKNILWLRNKLTCDEGMCTAQLIGDKC